MEIIVRRLFTAQVMNKAVVTEWGPGSATEASPEKLLEITGLGPTLDLLNLSSSNGDQVILMYSKLGNHWHKKMDGKFEETGFR